MPRRKPPLLGKLAVMLLAVASMSGCSAKPDSVKTILSPNKEVYYTIETSYGSGAVSNDYTRVYAHFSLDRKSRKQVVLGGEYNENTAITWISPTDVEMCVREGLTDTFRNQVTLITGDDPSSSYTIHNHFKEHC